MRMEGRAVEGIQWVEKEVYEGTILVTPDLDKKIRVKINILNFAMSRVLLIKYKNEKWRPVAFISKLLNKAERNYEIHNKKMLVNLIST